MSSASWVPWIGSPWSQDTGQRAQKETEYFYEIQQLGNFG